MQDSQWWREVLVELDGEELRSCVVASRWNDDGEGCTGALDADMASGRASGDRWVRGSGGCLQRGNQSGSQTLASRNRCGRSWYRSSRVAA